MKTLIAPFTALSLALALISCGAEGDDPQEAESIEQANTGFIPVSPPAGMLIVANGDGRVHTGYLVAADIAITGAAVTRGLAASRVSVELGVDQNHPMGTVARVSQILYQPDVDVAYLKLATPFATASFLPLDGRTPAQLAGLALRCNGYNQSRTLLQSEMNVIATSNASQTFQIQSFLRGDTIADDDDGIPCMDNAAGTVVGVALSSSGVVNTQIAARPIGGWLPVATQLFPIARQSGRFALYNVTGGVNLCLDIQNNDMGDHANVNQYPCHYQSNQLWYFDFRADAQHPMIVSARSGKCIDVPSGIPGLALQTFGCHGGANQRFAQYLHNPQGSGLAYVSGIQGSWSYPISSSLMCLSAQGGPSSGSRNTEVRACQIGTTANTDQRWFLSWR
jgi:hypothetical protein